ncbi:hypothetical protein [uncultured Roseobacter sp.]|uniref:hypothetical protein n=1 Tax=uncultured Roseobacter sp. TaxID=114847 RepID=UPI00262A5E34|nr:hypothetical protein [uncultured Roseobacter sp.]
MNVEIAPDPDLASKEFDEDDVNLGSRMLLQVLTQVALGSDEDAWALYHAVASAPEDANL